MSINLIALVTLIYAGVAANELRAKNFAMALVYAGYAVANVGLIATMKSGV